MLSLRRAGQLISRRHSQRSSWRLLDTQCKARDAVPQGSQYPFEPLLTRDFIAKSLYNRESGYFTKDVIYDLPGPLDYARLLGEWHYRLVVKQAYESKLSAWMTPVEIFSPHFSHALARYLARRISKRPNMLSSATDPPYSRHRHRASRDRVNAQRGDELVVYEVGGGTGTNALNILNWLKREEPELYERTEYTIVEISKRLAERQHERVGTCHKNCRVINADILEWGISGETDDRPCFFIAMEVLDNLPHDKIAWSRPSSGEEGRNDAQLDNVDHFHGTTTGSEDERRELCEAVVIQTSHGYRETFRPLRDPLIRELLDLCPDMAQIVMPPQLRSGNVLPSSEGISSWGSAMSKTLNGLFSRHHPHPDLREAFVPTGSLRLLHALRKRLPRHHAIFADFDSFPVSDDGGGHFALTGMLGSTERSPSLLAFQAPIVSSRDPVSGAVTDHDTYMVPLGKADIFFSTCFKRLSRLHGMVCSEGVGGRRCDRTGNWRGGLVMKQAEFLREYGDIEATRTMTGFNPMLEDYQNASVFLSGPH